MDELTALHEQMSQCTRCELRSGCTQVVPGEGPSDALITFFGEGPGANEDEQGRPFVGRAGQYLRTMLQSNRIPWKDVYISNTVRCRPPGNRDPKPEEAEACWEWTQKTLKVIRPRIVVTLGRPALMTLSRKLGFSKKVGQLSITKLAGKPIFVDERNFYCFPMLHPAYALRSMDGRESFSAHMKYLKKAIPGWLERPR